MQTVFKTIFLSFLLGFSAFKLFSQQVSNTLFDKELTQFEVWLGVPHSSVSNLPLGTYTSTNVHQGTPIGLNNDIKNVFSTVEENGELILKISGEIYGGLTSKKPFLIII